MLPLFGHYLILSQIPKFLMERWSKFDSEGIELLKPGILMPIRLFGRRPHMWKELEMSAISKRKRDEWVAAIDRLNQ